MKTAVEWLSEQLKKSLPIIWNGDFDTEIEQAKEMEKQQRNDAKDCWFKNTIIGYNSFGQIKSNEVIGYNCFAYGYTPKEETTCKNGLI